MNLSCRGLTRLDLSEIPRDIHHLELRDNRLVTIEGIGQLSNLSTLMLQNNELTEIPSEIGQLRKLDYL